MESKTQELFCRDGRVVRIVNFEAEDSCDLDSQDQSEIRAKRSRCDHKERDINEFALRKESNPSKKVQSKIGKAPLQIPRKFEAVLSIEKIRQKIFSLLTFKDLKNCRLVSRAWQIYATNDTMLNAEENRINIWKHKNENTFKVGENKSPKGTLEQLIESMDITGTKFFPCNSFSISGKIITDIEPDFHNFLYSHGFRIKKLRLKLIHVGPSFHSSLPAKYMRTEENELRTFISTLLLKQAPNLEKISIKINTTSFARAKIATFVENAVFESQKELTSNLNLRQVKLEGKIEQSLFVLINKLAPNLENLITNNLHWYQPENLWYLCTKINFSPIPSDFTVGQICPAEAIANMDDRLDLKELKLVMGKLLQNEYRELWPRIVEICNKLLEKCKHSLQKISLDQVSLLPGIKFPKMNKVKSIEILVFPNESKYRHFTGVNPICECFPNLETIIVNSTSKAGHDNIADNFLEQNAKRPRLNFSAVESVFSIEKIRQKIFSHLHLQDLKNTRLVSRAWLHTTNDTIVNPEENYIAIWKNEGENIFKIGDKNFPIGTLEQLTQFMNVTDTNTFPCDSFLITAFAKEIHTTDLENFLDNHGFRIKNLCLELIYGSEDSCCAVLDCFGYIQDMRTDFFVPEFITALIAKQAPNLEKLVIKVLTSLKINKSESVRNISKNIKRNLNLRHVKIEGEISMHLFENICNLAPNLLTLNIDTLRFYYQPKNRIHLCSKLVFCPNQYKDYDIETIANMNERLNLKELKLFMHNLLLNESKEMPFWATVICNKLLEKCKLSLKNICLDRMSFLRGIKFPRMDKVKSMDLLVFPKESGCDCDYRHFTKKTCLSDCFPNLETITVNSVNQLVDPVEFPLGSNDQKLTSVKVIKALNVKNGKYKINLLRKWFPNAILKKKH